MTLRNSATTWDIIAKDTASLIKYNLPVVMIPISMVVAIGWFLCILFEKGPVNEKHLLSNLIFHNYSIKIDEASIANQLLAISKPKKRLVVFMRNPKESIPVFETVVKI